MTSKLDSKINKILNKGPHTATPEVPTSLYKNVCPHCNKEIKESAEEKIEKLLQERQQTKVLETLIDRIVRENAEVLRKILENLPAIVQSQTQPVQESIPNKKEKKIFVNRDDKGEISSLTVRYVDMIQEDEETPKEEMYSTPEEIERVKSLI